MQKGYMLLPIAREGLRYIMTFVDGKIFNGMISIAGLSSFSAAVQLKHSISTIEQWVRKAVGRWLFADGGEMDLDPYLMPLSRESADVLLIDKACVLDPDIRMSLCPDLTSSRLRALLSKFRTDEWGGAGVAGADARRFAPDPVPANVMSALAVDDSNPSVDLKAAPVVPKVWVDVSQVTACGRAVPDLLRHNPRFSFLLPES